MLYWEMYEFERMDEDFRKYVNRFKFGVFYGFIDFKDYRFGLIEDEIKRYLELVDLYYGLILLRYGFLKFYLYLMK